MKELLKINYEQNSRQYLQENYMQVWKLEQNLQHGLKE